MPVVTLITDFGVGDPYVAMMKGRILSVDPGIKCIDITHDIEVGDIESASFLLLKSYKYFPEDSVHLAIVDPTVGGSRRAIFSQFQNHLFVGPDNGVLSPFLSRTYRINKNTELDPKTFEGRDVFAPVAAYLAIGKEVKHLGVRIFDPVKIELSKPRMIDSTLIGEIIYIDHFGNLISNINEDILPSSDIEIEIKGKKIEGLSRNYEEGKDKGLLALINGGFGLLEVALYKGNAALYTGCKKGEKIAIRRKDE
ncbi:SAM-dependent chlorinase/fluorinase [candidate division WOR-3 bacterium]|jgi:S-adenosylmethionine hydrolase|nr:SAM-dependent chlorinase/fluorinase [candidate division WOR-3 bacterium]